MELHTPDGQLAMANAHDFALLRPGRDRQEVRESISLNHCNRPAEPWAAGRARALQVTQPPFIARPQYWIDGQEPNGELDRLPGRRLGAWRNTRLMALPVPEGEHELVVKN